MKLKGRFTCTPMISDNFDDIYLFYDVTQKDYSVNCD